MAKEFSRTRRLGEQIQRELAVLIQREVKDPRVGFVTVSAVDVSRDLAHAKVYITELGEAGHRDECLQALNHAASFLRHELGQRLSVRHIPELKFTYDTSIERGARLESLIKQAVSKKSQQSED